MIPSFALFDHKAVKTFLQLEHVAQFLQDAVIFKEMNNIRPYSSAFLGSGCAGSRFSRRPSPQQHFPAPPAGSRGVLGQMRSIIPPESSGSAPGSPLREPLNLLIV